MNVEFFIITLILFELISLETALIAEYGFLYHHTIINLENVTTLSLNKSMIFDSFFEM